MSNPINNKSYGVRGRLLASASIVSLIASVAAIAPAFAAAGEAPLTVELNWQIDNNRYSQSKEDLPLGPLVPQSGLTAPLFQSLDLSRNSDLGGELTYSPDDSDWQFSVSVRYGRAAGKAQINQALAPIPTTSFVSYAFTYPLYPSSNVQYLQHVAASREKLNGSLSNDQSHLIVDFEAGQDVGIGLFGRNSTSVLSAGARFAHFTASRQIENFEETRGIQFQTSTFMTTVYPGYGTKRHETWNVISASGGTSQTFDGLGPSIKWEASTELWHDPRGGGLSFDWGINAALLFGKQKKTIQHETQSDHNCWGGGCPRLPPQTSADRVSVAQNVTVPNVGGFAGLSLAYPNAKVSLGYRADLFMNAVDVGFSTRKSTDLLFHGPYASISIGIGN